MSGNVANTCGCNQKYRHLFLKAWPGFMWKFVPAKNFQYMVCCDEEHWNEYNVDTVSNEF